MKKRFTEEKIVRILKEGEGSGKISDVCRKYGISDATFYIWRKKYQGMGGDDVRKLKNLEDENRRLKKLLADKELDIDALKAILEKYGQAR